MNECAKIPLLELPKTIQFTTITEHNNLMWSRYYAKKWMAKNPWAQGMSVKVWCYFQRKLRPTPQNIVQFPVK